MQRLPSVYVGPSDLHGRGVFTHSYIPAGTLIEICPAIILPADEVSIIHSTRLHDYYFLWGDTQKEAAIVLGFGSMYNHAEHPNARYIMDYEQQSMDFFATSDIEAGSEILVNYRDDSEAKFQLWFQEK
ncbi:MAG: SET domain-containing protein [Bacteroidota bacterium]